MMFWLILVPAYVIRRTSCFDELSTTYDDRTPSGDESEIEKRE